MFAWHHWSVKKKKINALSDWVSRWLTMWWPSSLWYQRSSCQHCQTVHFLSDVRRSCWVVVIKLKWAAVSFSFGPTRPAGRLQIHTELEIRWWRFYRTVLVFHFSWLWKSTGIVPFSDHELCSLQSRLQDKMWHHICKPQITIVPHHHIFSYHVYLTCL